MLNLRFASNDFCDGILHATIFAYFEECVYMPKDHVLVSVWADSSGELLTPVSILKCFENIIVCDR